MADISQRQCADLEEWQQIAEGKTAPLLVAPIKGAAIAAGLVIDFSKLERLVGFCGLAYQGRNDIDDIIPSSHRSSDLDGRKPNMVISLFAKQGAGREDFNRWYQSEDNSQLTHWQRRIASSEVISLANQSVDQWLVQAELLVNMLPEQLQPVAHGLVASVEQKIIIKSQRQIA
ncbi:MAG: polyprenyl synthetase family protein, partial [Porticoccaceae bacterium]